MGKKLKNVFLFRHGKSDWSDSNLTDHSRPLSKRGFKDVPKMTEVLISKCSNIEIILSSTSMRTTQTVENMLDIFLKNPKVNYLDELYLASKEKIIECLNKEIKKYSNIVIVGHNPGLSEIVNLASLNEGIHLPTAALAHLSSDKDNSQIGSINDFKLVSLNRPKDYYEI